MFPGGVSLATSYLAENGKDLIVTNGLYTYLFTPENLTFLAEKYHMPSDEFVKNLKGELNTFCSEDYHDLTWQETRELTTFLIDELSPYKL